MFVDERLRSAFAYDAQGWILLDPDTLMLTGGIRSSCPGWACAAVRSSPRCC